MGKLDHTNLSNQQKLEINSYLKHLENFFKFFDDCPPVAAREERFLFQCNHAIKAYVDLIKNGSQPDRAKYILMQALKEELTSVASQPIHAND